MGTANALLKLDPTGTDLTKQKQKLLGGQISTTKDKLNALKQAAMAVPGKPRILSMLRKTF